MKLGIDYGTTTTLVSLTSEFRGRTTSKVLDIGGDRSGYMRSSVPSVLAVTRDGGIAVGYEAERIKEENPGQVVVLRSLKRCLACERKGEDVIDSCWNPMNRPFCCGDQKLKVFGQHRAIHELVGAFIDGILNQQMVKPIYSDDSLKNIGVAVPAIFGGAPRRTIYSLMIQKVKDPVNIEVVNEPTAALLACKDKTLEDEDGIYAIMDVGGGTTDIVVYEKKEKNLFLFKPCGLRVAGDNVDDVMLRRLFRKQWDRESDGDRVIKEVRRAKERLSVLSEVTVLGKKLSREDFQEIIRPVLSEIVGALRHEIKTIFDSYKPHSQTGKEFKLKRIYLSGGGSRIPLLMDLIKNDPWIGIFEPEVAFLRNEELYSIYADDVPIVLVALGTSIPKKDFVDTIQNMLPYSIILIRGDKREAKASLYEELPVEFSVRVPGDSEVQIFAVDPNAPEAPVHNLTDELVAIDDPRETVLSELLKIPGIFDFLIDKYNIMRVSKGPPHKRMRSFPLPWQGGIETALFEKYRKEWRRKHGLN